MDKTIILDTLKYNNIKMDNKIIFHAINNIKLILIHILKIIRNNKIYFKIMMTCILNHPNKNS